MFKFLKNKKNIKLECCGIFFWHKGQNIKKNQKYFSKTNNCY